MGDLHDWSPEHIVSEERPSSSTSFSSFLSSTLPVISNEYWVRAEEATQGIIAQVQPTIVSEERRKAVIDYVQRLIRNYLGCEVFPFGSVPLKTYLPDGDIDLTAFGGLNLEDALANEVCSVLEREDQNPASEFVVKDVQLIRAEVKLVKCLVQNIVVDISFNQLGGLCTLCFLEQVDRLIGKDHLFKRSIILIKAWCYYESRILGAHHGLISTYALETLVLYIFHLFNSSLNGPLAVLYKFLDYFSKFDWDNYCISLNGPIRMSGLPEFVVEAPENGGSDLLLSNDFLKDCLEMFSVPSRGFEASSRTFSQKYLNIVDPLKENNNLGRSVSKGNFYRIRSAFTYGARKLGHILSQAEGNIADELRKFFSNTLDRHGSGQRPDVQNRSSVPRYSGFGVKPSISGTDSFPEEQSVCGEELMGSSIIINPNGKVDHDGLEVHMSANDGNYNGTVSSSDGTAVSEKRLLGDATDLATSRLQGSNGLSGSSSLGSWESISGLHQAGHALFLNSSNSSLGNGDMSNGIEKSKHPQYSNFANKKVASDEESPVGLKVQKQPQSNQNSTWALEDLYTGYPVHMTSTGAMKNPEAPLSLSDLFGDYNSHLRNLQYGRGCCEYNVNAHIAPISPTLHAQYLSNNSWDMMRRSAQFRKNMTPPVKTNGFVPRPVYSVNLHGAGFGMEEMPKPRGTGTYFPNTNHYRDRSWTGRGRNHGSARSPRSNDHVLAPAERKSPERSCERMQSNAHPSSERLGSPELQYWRTPERMFHGANGVVDHLENTSELESFGCPVISIPPTDESWKHEESVSPLAQSLSSVHLEPQAKQTTATERDRILMQTYQLKDEGDFPPLSERFSKR